MNLNFILFLISIINSLKAQELKPFLRISPNTESVNQPSGQQFVVTCRGEGQEPKLFSDLKWFDPRNEEITESYTKYKNLDVRVEWSAPTTGMGALLLHFLRPSPDTSGQYRCSATFQHSDSLEAKIQITFFEDVQWEDCPQIQSLIEGNSGERIRCKASANPKPNISWMKGDKPLNEERYHIDSNGIRIEHAIQQSDGGAFRVRALVTETGRLHDKYITVQVHVRPKITSLPQNWEAVEGEPTSLRCEANGMPEPMFTWFDPNRRNLSSVGGYSVDRNSGLLLVSKVRKTEDNGQFTCIAENSAGRDERATMVVVLLRPLITSFENKSFDENKESLLECRATGSPTPELSIRKDGNSRPFLAGDARVTLTSRVEREETVLSLSIVNTERSDDGLYFCRAENKGGTVERVGHLEVRFSPDLRRTPLTTVKSWAFKPVNITCIADSIPNATIKWWFRGQELFNGAHNEIYHIRDNGDAISQLFINSKGFQHKSDIYGLYRCEAHNSLGRSHLDIQLEQAFAPGAIMQVTHERITPTTITFKLFGPSIDGGLPITRIHCQYREEDKPLETLKTKSWPVNGVIQSTNYYLDGLWPRTRYVFRFAAENAVGIGDFSPEKALITERESQPQKPEFHNLPFESTHANSEVISPFPDKFTAIWNLPEDNGRKIRFFEIKFYPVQKSENGFQEFPNSSPAKLESISMSSESMTSYTLNNLVPNTYYRIELRANNELGFSPMATLVFRTASTDRNSTEYDSNDLNSASAFSTSSVSLRLIIALIIIALIVILVLMDITFYFRFKVGAIHFLITHLCPMANSSSNHSKPLNTNSHHRNNGSLSHALDRELTHESSSRAHASADESFDNPVFDGGRADPMGKDSAV